MDFIGELIAKKNKNSTWGFGNFPSEKRSLKKALSQKNSYNMSIIGELRNFAPTYGQPAKWKAEQLISEYADTVQAINVFIEKYYFGGDIQWISLAKNNTDLPIIVLDFFTSSQELDIVKSHGADAVILISDILNKNQLEGLVRHAKKINLEVIVEVQDEKGVSRALSVGTDFIGINNRKLNDLKVVDLSKIDRLKSLIPSNVPIIIESGIEFPHDQFRYNTSAEAIMVGTAFVESGDVRKCLKSFSELSPSSMYPFIWTKPAAYLQDSGKIKLSNVLKKIGDIGFFVKRRYPIEDASKIVCEMYKSKLAKYPKAGLYWYWVMAAYYDYIKQQRVDGSEIIFFEKKNNLFADLNEINRLKYLLRQNQESQGLVYSFCGKSAKINLHTFHAPDGLWANYIHDIRILFQAGSLSEDVVSYVVNRSYRKERWYKNEHEEEVPWLQ